jgi:carbonic anhydrase
MSEALARLLEGNRRFVEEHPRAPVPSARRIELASGQNPFAVVLGCSDSRVPIETIFDQYPGDLFVVRSAGHTLGDENLASIEYGVELLQCKLVVVLGHSACGAVAAAMSLVESGTAFPGHIARLAEAIAPAVRTARAAGDDWWLNAVKQNVRDAMHVLFERSAILAGSVASGALRIVGAIYDLHTGGVFVLD